MTHMYVGTDGRPTRELTVPTIPYSPRNLTPGYVQSVIDEGDQSKYGGYDGYGGYTVAALGVRLAINITDFLRNSVIKHIWP